MVLDYKMLRQGVTPMADFERVQQEFDLKKQALALQKQLGAAKISAEMNAQSLPFQGNSWDAQIANEAYKFNLSKGLDPDTAKRSAIDQINRSKVTGTQVIDPITGEKSIQIMPRNAIFGNLGSPQGGDPVREHAAAVMGMQGGNPNSGSRQLPTPAVAQPPQGQDINLYSLADDTAGFISGGHALYGASPLAQIFGVHKNTEKVLEARQTMETSKRDLIRALSVNPRYAVGEMNDIAKEVNIAPSIWDSPDALRSRMRSISQSLQKRVYQETRAANDRSLPVATRQAALQSANDLRNFLDILGAPEAEQGNDIDQLIEMYSQ